LTIILFTTRAPHPLAGELAGAGFEVHEALAISEVFALAERYPSAQIVITSGIDATRARIIQQRYPTVVISNYRIKQ
jgi:hypothetical protein